MKITPAFINEWMLQISTSKHTVNGKLSSSTVCRAKDILKSIFNFAIQNLNINYNPATKVSSIKKFTNDRRAKFWTIEQYTEFYNSIEKDCYKVAFNVMFFAGLRLGEVMGLRPMDIKEFYINVRNNHQQLGKGMEYNDSPKTKSSIRKVPIPKFLYYQIQDYIASVYDLKDDECILRFKRDSCRKYLNKRIQMLGLPEASPHTFRHSYASLRYSQTKDFTLVAHCLGHSNAAISARIYTHFIQEDDNTGIEELEKLNPEKQKKL